jgi:putative transposase
MGEGPFVQRSVRLAGTTRSKKNNLDDPTSLLIDAFTVKSTHGGEEVGFDGHKKLNGRKRQLACDSQGILMGVGAHDANVHDSQGACALIEEMATVWPTIERAFVDLGYRGAARDLMESYGWTVHFPPPKEGGFHSQLLRWRVERTISWLRRFRRLELAHERKVVYDEAFVWLANHSICFHKLKPFQKPWSSRWHGPRRETTC